MAFARPLFIFLVVLASIWDWIEVTEAQGVCYGLLGDNLPPPSQVVDMFNQYNIESMRIFDPNPDVMRALDIGGSRIQLTIGVKNEDIQSIAGSIDAAREWFAYNIEGYSNIPIQYIVVGNEVIPGDLAECVLPAMENLQTVIESSSKPGIGVTTVVALNVLASSYPPSSGAFTEDTRDIMVRIFGNLVSHNRPLMLNAYPYLAYASDPAHVNLDYCLFTATEPVVRDEGLEYYNMLDAMIDAVHAAAEKVRVPNVSIEISETGWPSAGNGNFTTPGLAGTYNRNLRSRLVSGKGTPRRPDELFSGMIFAMFNENLKPAGIEQNWGLFYPDCSPVYPFF